MTTFANFNAIDEAADTQVEVSVFKPGDAVAVNPTLDEQTDLIASFGNCSTIAALLTGRKTGLDQ